MTGPWFVACVKQIPEPTLQPGDAVVLDDLPPHKNAAVRWGRLSPISEV